MIMLMLAGFTLIEAGAVRKKNQKFLITKNFMVLVLSFLGWWLSGYALAYGDVKNFIGTEGGYAVTREFDDLESSEGVLYLHFLREYAYCAATCVIFTIPMGERCQLAGVGIAALLMSMFLYPIIVAQTWAENGWLWDRDY